MDRTVILAFTFFFLAKSVSKGFKIQLSTAYAAESSGVRVSGFKSSESGLNEAVI